MNREDLNTRFLLFLLLFQVLINFFFITITKATHRCALNYDWKKKTGCIFSHVYLNSRENFKQKLTIPNASNIELIEFDYSTIEIVPTKFCHPFLQHKILRLELYATKTKKFEREALKFCSDLEEFELKFCPVMNIDATLFEFSPELSSIYLECNDIESIDRNAFANNLKLRKLNLNYNKLIQFTVSSSLVGRHLVVGSKISIYLRNNELQDISMEYFPRNKFEIDIVDNELKCNELRKFEDFNISEGLNFTCIDSMEVIVEDLLPSNSTRAIKASIEEKMSYNCSVLFNSYCIYHHIELNIQDDATEKLIYTRKDKEHRIFFYNSQIITFPASICERFEAYNFIHLELFATKTEHFQKEALKTCKFLDKFYFSFNPLKKVTKSLFKFNENLLEIKLEANDIESIHPLAFMNNKKLKRLDLGFNKLIEFTFTPMLSHLEQITLQGNLLQNIHFNFTERSKLKFIINGNPLTCGALNKLTKLTLADLKLREPDASINIFDRIFTANCEDDDNKLVKIQGLLLSKRKEKMENAKLHTLVTMNFFAMIANLIITVGIWIVYKKFRKHLQQVEEAIFGPHYDVIDLDEMYTFLE